LDQSVITRQIVVAGGVFAPGHFAPAGVTPQRKT
jgi:hypothetical protein